MSYHRDKDGHIRSVGAIAWRDGVGARFDRSGAAAAQRDLVRDHYRAAMTSPNARAALGMINTTRGDDGSTGVTTGGGNVPTSGRPTRIVRVPTGLVSSTSATMTSRPGGMVRPITIGGRPGVLVPKIPSRATSIGVATAVVPIEPSSGGGGGGGSGGGGTVTEIPPETPEVEDPILEAPIVAATGMSTKTKILIGAGVLAGLYYLSKKKG